MLTLRHKYLPFFMWLFPLLFFAYQFILRLWPGLMMNQIMDQFSPDDRELIRLRYIADMSLNDIAKILKINPVTVRVRMHRALAFAKIILKNQQYE